MSWHDKRLYFSGDTESPDSLLAARELDVAFVSPWQYQAATRRGPNLDAKHVVIYHHAAGQHVEGLPRFLPGPEAGGHDRDSIAGVLEERYGRPRIAS